MISEITDNVAAIQQGIDLLESLDDDAYTRTHEACFQSSIGGHLRHNIDHYLCFFDGLDDRQVDYDKRQRAQSIETVRQHALQALIQIAEQMQCMSQIDLNSRINIRMDTGSNEDVWTESSLRRELQFLLSHTVHHYALIAIMCNLIRDPLPEDFGVAPSTLRYRTINN